MLNIKKFDQALRFAIDSGDPNIIDKVFTEILKDTRGKGEEAYMRKMEMFNKIEDSIRHLRNYAKKRNDTALLMTMIKFQQDKATELANMTA